jgi:PilZ domain
MAVAVLTRHPGMRLRLPSGDSLPARLVGQDGQALLVAVAESRVAADEACAILVLDERRAGFLVDVHVTGIELDQDGDDRLRCAVTGVRRVKSRRVAARALVSESAVVEGGKDAFDVQVADVSAYGMAFVTDERFEVDEEVALTLNVEHQVVPVRALVTNVTALGPVLRRVGCRFTRIAELHRHVLDSLAERAEPASDRRETPQPAAASGLMRRLAEPSPGAPASAPDEQAPAPDRWSMTALYCAACARFTLHHRPSAVDAAWSCMTCDANPAKTPPTQPDQGAERRAA